MDALAPNADETPVAWRMPTYVFHMRQVAHALTRAQRETVAARSRFYTMGWLSCADVPDLGDELP